MDEINNFESNEPAPIEPQIVPQKSRNPWLIPVIAGGGAFLLLIVGIGAYFILKPSPATPYLKEVCATVGTMQLNKTSYNDNKAAYESVSAPMATAYSLDPKESGPLNDLVDKFGTLVSDEYANNLQFALAVTFNDYTKLNLVKIELDRLIAVGKELTTGFEAECKGRM